MVDKTPNFLDEVVVELVEHVGDDESIIRAARVSTGNDREPQPPQRAKGLINYLVKHRHGSPLEHNSMTFRIMAPIFVFREFHRHRIGWSYNEVSGRYKELDPNFYVYPAERPLVQSGSSAHPNLEHGDPALAQLVDSEVRGAYEAAWDAYQRMLEAGVANEVARAVLPVGIFSEMYATCNARSLMAFLSLRVDSPDATYQTKPQYEIQKVAEKMEAEFARLFPLTHEAFVANGRVAP